MAETEFRRIFLWETRHLNCHISTVNLRTSMPEGLVVLIDHKWFGKLIFEVYEIQLRRVEHR